MQAESAEELAAIRTQFAGADSEKVFDEPNVNCCYARGNKHWTKDPQGIAWEAFHTLDSVPVYGDDANERRADDHGKCRSDEHGWIGVERELSHSR